LATKHDGWFPGVIFLHQGFFGDGSHRRPEEVRRANLILHGDDDQIVPVADSALLSAKIFKNATLKVVKGAPHGMCSTLKDMVNAELIAFARD